MRKFLFSLVFAITAIAAQAQDPAVTMTTSLQNGSDVEFYLASLADNTTVQVDWGDGTPKNFTIGQYNTAVSGTTAGTTIKVYGTGITSLSAGYFNLTALNVSKATSLTHLTVNNNQLQSLDIASNTNLQFIDCSNNQLEALSVTNNIKLEKIYCFKNKLTTIDITSNADLWELDCSNNLMTTLNFSSVTSDVVIDCSNNLLTSLILGKNMNSVRCKNNALTSLDVSQNTSLYLLDCSNNQINSLNLSNNVNLQYLICSYNKLSALNLLNNPSLTEVYCTNNKFTLATLPIKQTYWNVYNYNPQAIYSLPKKNYETGESINLSSQLSVNGVNSVYTWKTKGGQTLNAGTHYTVTNGVFVFNSVPTDSVYCEITNTNLADIKLTTNSILVTPPVPNVAMTTSLTIGSSFFFSIGATTNNSPIKVDWGNGTLVSYMIGTMSSDISGTLTGNSVKIFGEGISFLNLENLKLTSLDIKGAPDLSFLNCTSNQLTSLDVSNNTLLRTLWCGGNKFTTLDVSKNTELDQLACGMNQITSIDVSKNTKITVLHCYSNKITTIDVSKNIILKTFLCNNNQLTNLDVSKNTELAELRCNSNKITALDLSKNIALTDLDCGSNPLINIDLTKNTELIKVSCTFTNITVLNVTNNLKLVEFYCQYNQLTSLDISKNTALKKLVCSTNKLSSLDISKNVLLTELSCDVNSLNSLDVSKNVLLTKLSCFENKLSSLDVSKNVNLTILNCTWNLLSIGTLPIKQPTWTTYTYSPQAKISLPKGEFAINEEIDLSGQLNSGSSTTTYTWKTQGGKTLVKDVDYTESNGKFTFIKQPGDYFYCEMTNATFPELNLTTENISITQATPTITMTTTTTVGSTFSFEIIGTADNIPIKLDWGNGTLVTYTITTIPSNISGTLAGNTINIYGIGITSLHLSSRNLTALNVSESIALKNLRCYYNELTSLDVSKNIALQNLDCSGNKLTTLDVSKNTLLTFLRCDYNQITILDVSKNTKLTDLDCYSNLLTVLDVSNNALLTKLQCYSNKLTFATLPLQQPTWTRYTYSPQLKLALPKNEYALNEEIDLSSQLTIGGNISVYTWKTVGGITLVKDMDYTENNGIFVFLKQPGDYFYCEMKNATFPDLTLTTENISIAQTEPTITMITTRAVGNTFSFQIKSTTDNDPIKVDWGNGSLTDYTIGTYTSSISGTLVGSTIKIYGVGIEHLYLYSRDLTALDVTKNTSLKSLNCASNKLSTLDVTKNIALISLWCYSNQLTSLDVTKNTELIYLYCYANKLASLDITKNSVLKELSCGSNQITTLNAFNNALLTHLYCSNNLITSLDVSKNTDLTTLNCSSNQLKFSTLPLKQTPWATYTYHPQNTFNPPKKQYGLTETIDLSSELTVDGKTTNYIWKTKGGATLTAGTDYNVTNGVTTFLKVQSDSVYCQMMNATFPALTLNTSKIKVSQYPLSVGENEVAIKVYPNPATQYFSVEMAEEIVRVEVYTLTGVKVFENGMYNSTKVTIPLGNMPKGALLVRTFTRNGAYESKVLKM